MMSDKKDKLISILFMMLSIGVIIWWIIAALLNAGPEQSLYTLFTLENIVNWGQDNLDIVIISYVFICLQAAGYSELTHRQDYLLVAIISLIFTPIGLLFIKSDENEN
jgi:Na+-driven multidrug efflux pump